MKEKQKEIRQKGERIGLISLLVYDRIFEYMQWNSNLNKRKLFLKCFCN